MCCVALALALVGCAWFNAHAPLTRRLGPDRGRAVDATALLTWTVRGKALTACAGAWIAPDLILTAGHCVGRYELRAYSTDTALDHVAAGEPVEVVRRNPMGDLALLRVGHPMAPVVLPVGHGAQPGVWYTVVGHPAGQAWVRTWARIDRVAPDCLLISTGALCATWARGQGRIWGGNSGGPMIDGRGRLQGITSWMQHTPDDTPTTRKTAGWVDARDIREFLAHSP